MMWDFLVLLQSVAAPAIGIFLALVVVAWFVETGRRDKVRRR